MIKTQQSKPEREYIVALVKKSAKWQPMSLCGGHYSKEE
jgi:hypothetical protein